MPAYYSNSAQGFIADSTETIIGSRPVMPRPANTLAVIFVMGLFTSVLGCTGGDEESNGNGRYVTEQSFRENLALQTAMSPKIVEQLRQHGVTNDAALKLEFFFYTDTEKKARALATALRNLDYEVEIGPSAGNDGLFLATGWTTPIKMDNRSVVAWTEEMCRLGYKHDCEFDGWGTNLRQ